jgi:hypothetical protein
MNAKTKTPVYSWDYIYSGLDDADFPGGVEGYMALMKKCGLGARLLSDTPDENGDYQIRVVGNRKQHNKFDMALGGHGIEDEGFEEMEYLYDEEDWDPDWKDEDDDEDVVVDASHLNEELEGVTIFACTMEDIDEDYIDEDYVSEPLEDSGLPEEEEW